MIGMYFICEQVRIEKFDNCIYEDQRDPFVADTKIRCFDDQGDIDSSQEGISNFHLNFKLT